MIAIAADGATDMSPPRETTQDASKLTFPVQMVILIVGMVGAMYAGTYGLRSDVRDILTRMEAQAELAKVQNKAQEDRMAAARDDVNEIKRRLELVQLQYQQLRETMIETRTRR